MFLGGRSALSNNPDREPSLRCFADRLWINKQDLLLINEGEDKFPPILAIRLFFVKEKIQPNVYIEF